MARVSAQRTPSGFDEDSTPNSRHETSESAFEAAGEVAEARGEMYRFLSSVFLAPPQVALLRQIVNRQFLDELSSVFGEHSVTQLREFAATADVDRDAVTLKQEYMDLFGVPTGRYVSPFEDVHWAAEIGQQRKWGPLLGNRAIEVLRKYRAAGAEIDRACKELPTHVGVELSFMSFLCEREAATTRSPASSSERYPSQPRAPDRKALRELQSRFLDEHLSRWFPRLSETIQDNARSPFYRGLAVFSERFLAHDSASLAEVSSE